MGQRLFAVVAASGCLLFVHVPRVGAQPVPPAAVPIAVLPLTNDSGDATQDFIADGLTDEIAAALSKVPGLDVLARSSIFRFKGQNAPIETVGKTLKVRYLLQGSARKVESRVRLSARLIRVDGGDAVWAHDYDANFDKIFDVQAEIAENVRTALHLRGRLSSESLVRSRARNVVAYQDFLRAKVIARARGAQALADAAKVLETVVAREPDYVPALALLAYDYALTPLFEQSLRSAESEAERKVVERSIPRADMLARRATTLDAKSADAFVALAYVNLVQMKMVAAEDAFKRALALDPNHADGMHGYSQFLAATGRIRESLAMRQHLQDVEPFVMNYTADTAVIDWLDGQTDKAIALLEPFRPGRTLELALIHATAGRYREAAALVREMPAANYVPGMTEAAAGVLESSPTDASSPQNAPKLGNLGFAYLHLGAVERVLEFYEAEIDAGYFQPISTAWLWHPSFAPVRKTERFKRVMSNLGLAEYWRARGWPASCHPTGPGDFTCS